MFGADQVQESGKKLLQEETILNDDSSNLQHLSALNHVMPIRSDIMMSSNDGENTYEIMGQ
jgi:hypothetical protein